MPTPPTKSIPRTLRWEPTWFHKRRLLYQWRYECFPPPEASTPPSHTSRRRRGNIRRQLWWAGQPPWGDCSQASTQPAV